MPPSYPLIGPNVQSIFEYIKFEQEEINLGTFTFDPIGTFGLPPNFNYVTDFLNTPVQGGPDGETILNTTHGLVKTCDLSCAIVEASTEIAIDNVNVRVGPAIRIATAATKDNASLVAVVNDPILNKVVLSKWLNQPLTDYGAILGTIDGALDVGAKLKIRSLEVNIYDVLINDILVLTVNDNTLSEDNTCVGIIQLPFEIKTFIPGTESTDINHSVRRFYYCNDGISIVNPFKPVNISDNRFEDTLDIFLKSGSMGEKCYGFYYAQGFTNTDLAGAAGRGYYIEGQFIYGPAINGSPISGLCFRVDESKADPDDFTGWVVLINKRDHKIQLAYYLNESLKDLPLPSHIVATVNKDIEPGTKVFFSASMAANVSNNLWQIQVKTEQPSQAQVTDITYIGAKELPVGEQITIRQARTNWGLVWVGNAQFGTHIAEWQGVAPNVYAIIN